MIGTYYIRVPIENDSALEDEERTENSQPLSEDEDVPDVEDNNDYNFDEDVYHNDNGVEEEEDLEGDDDSTPHVRSETSKVVLIL